MRSSLSSYFIHDNRRTVTIASFLGNEHCWGHPGASALCNYVLLQHHLDMPFNFVSVIGWSSLWMNSHWVTCGRNEVVGFFCATWDNAEQVFILAYHWFKAGQ